MKRIVLILQLLALAAACFAAEEPTDADLVGLSESEIQKKLGPAVTNFMHSAVELYANAEKSSPVARALAKIIKESSSEDVQIKTLVWQAKRFRMARLVQKNRKWIVFGMEGLPASWGREGRESPNQGIQPTK